jgi:hypothetical protein
MGRIFDQFSTVPTLLERQGNFSQTTYTRRREGATGRDFNPATGTLRNNTIPQINSVAAGLPPYFRSQIFRGFPEFSFRDICDQR